MKHNSPHQSEAVLQSSASGGTLVRKRPFSAKRLLSAAVVTFGVTAGLPAWAACTLSGAGTSADPYLVADAAGLAQVGVDCALTASYKQTADITLTGSNNLTPIGTNSGSLFSGVYDGGGFKIAGLNQSVAITDSMRTMGLFGWVGSTATNTTTEIRNLTLEGASITVTASNNIVHAGVLVGRLGPTGGTTYITNVVVKDSSVTPTAVGVPVNGGGVIGTLYPSGGIANISHTHAQNVTVAGSITGTGTTSNLELRVGGLIGWIGQTSTTSVISKVSSSGSVTGRHNGTGTSPQIMLGGLVGGIDAGAISDAYSTASVAATTALSYWGVGGLVGMAGGGTISRVYAVGAVNGANSTQLCAARCGGLAGNSFATFNNSFWDTQTTSMATSTAGTGKTTAEMKTATTFATWDGSTVWTIQDGAYPTLMPYVPPNAAPTASAVAITGTAKVGIQLTGSYTYADAESNPEGTSTFRWMSDSVAGAGATKAAIGGATSSTYTPVVGDQGKILFFCVTPVASAGTTTGTEVCSSATAAVAANAAPTASAVAITGTAQVGVQLTGSYTYADAESNPQGTSTFRWMSDSVAGAGATKAAIGGATSSTYTPVVGDQGKILFFCVTPVASAGTTTGTEVCSSATAAVAAANVAPTASAVAITGTAQVGAQLTGSYTYADADADIQGTSTFKWYSDSASSGATKVAISGATSANYTVASADQGKYLFFCVTPKAQTGALNGTETCSTATTTVAAAPVAPPANPIPTVITPPSVAGVGGNSLNPLNLSSGDGPAMTTCLRDQIRTVIGSNAVYQGQMSDGGARIGQTGLVVSFYALDATTSTSYGLGQGAGIYLRASNPLAVVTSCGTFTTVPAMYNLTEWGTFLSGMGLTAQFNAQGVMTVVVGSTTYVARPDYSVTQGEPGAPRLVTGSDGLMRFIDSAGNTQILYPAFSEPETLGNQVAQAVGGYTVIQTDGKALVTLFNGQKFLLTPDMTLGTVPPEHLASGWWQDGPNHYRFRIYTVSGASQGFTVTPQ